MVTAMEPQTTLVRRRVVGVVIGVLVIFAGGYVLTQLTDVGPHAGVPVQIYAYQPVLDLGEGGPQCSEDGMVAIERIVPRTKNSAYDAVRQVLDGRLTVAEREEGLVTEFPLEGVHLKSVTILNGTAVVAIDDPQFRTSGGACRATIMRLQVEKTLLQFPHISAVRFEPESLFQP